MKLWWYRLTPYAFPEWPRLLLVAAGTLALVGVKLLAPWPLKFIVDNVLVDQPLPAGAGWIASLPAATSPHGLLAWLAAATVFLFLLRRAISITVAYVKTGVGSRMIYALAADVFQHLQHRSLIFHNRRRVGDLVKRVTDDSTCVRSLVMNLYLPILTSLATLVSMFAIMWTLSPVTALFAVGVAFPLAVVTRLLAGPMEERAYQEQQTRGELMSLAEQALTSLPVIQAFGREPDTDCTFRDQAEATLQANLSALRAQEAFGIATSLLTTGATAAVMIVGGLGVLRGEVTVGSLLVLLSYFNALYSPIETLAYIGAGFASAGAGARRVLEVIDEDELFVQDSATARPLPADRQSRGLVAVEHVTFGYASGQPVLHNVSFTARPGEITALVGPTGAGKSTLASLIARLYDPWDGRVMFDGIDLRDITLGSLRENVAVVLQDPLLLRISVAENIAYGCPHAMQEQIVSAAEAADAHRFIEALPDGYDTVIGEGGVTLSGGERQRLSIARALLQDAPVLILDEPTSALDTQTETSVITALERLIEGRTTFIIAHRPSTIRRADRLIVLEKGRVSADCPPDELLGVTTAESWSHAFGNAFADVRERLPADLASSPGTG
jgi:ATP-binding cassette, subfamily B, bacterial